MNKQFLTILAGCLIVSLVAIGCGAAKSESPKAAIDYSKTLKDTQEKVDYLVSQAKTYYNSKQFQGAVDIAQYVLRYLDSDSAAAKDLLQKAKDQLTAATKSAIEQAKKGFAGVGK